ncbi:hypothetical protein [Rheinheimera soli]|uniref:N-acetyltransferase domain-containing protein n=1 Tax=Rheinheimera soli TaxID=443616 RepID=A0ABU1W151_9GAMM|nr:hypothetical protein [Rheinheimera soli]MDR7121685.1 hypothetical protein [Rheinheimera soli]
MRREQTSYHLLKVHPHQQRPDCETSFYCLAKIKESSSGDEFLSEKHRVSIELSIFESSIKNSWYDSRVIENPSFDVELSRSGDDKYHMKTLHFYVDTPWARDRGLGKYMMIKIFNILKEKVDHDFVGKLFFSLSANQGKDEKKRRLRNHFYKSIGCTLEGHEDNPDAWNTAEHARALFNFDLLPTSWNKEKVEEISLAQGFQNLFSERSQLLETIKKQESMLEYHKENTAIVYKWRSRLEIFWIWAARLTFLSLIVISIKTWLNDNF